MPVVYLRNASAKVYHLYTQLDQCLIKKPIAISPAEADAKGLRCCKWCYNHLNGIAPDEITTDKHGNEYKLLPEFDSHQQIITLSKEKPKRVLNKNSKIEISPLQSPMFKQPFVLFTLLSTSLEPVPLRIVHGKTVLDVAVSPQEPIPLCVAWNTLQKLHVTLSK